MKLDTEPLETGKFKVCHVSNELLSSLVEKLRTMAMHEQRIVEEAPVNLRVSEFGDASKKTASKDARAKKTKKHEINSKERKLDEELREKLAAKLNRDASVILPVVVKGMKFTRNERKKIIAAISLAEGSFVSVNKDYEFHMPKERAEKIPVSYYGVVHIGLSWGLIQFTQDSGTLGGLLQFMRKQNQAKFDSIFGDNSDELVHITTAEDKPGQTRFKELDATEQNRRRKTGEEIRSARVQPIAVTKGGEKKDLWEEPWLSRFKQAGLDEEFQDAQLLYAVNRYINEADNLKHKMIIHFLKECQIQTALGIALVVDRAIQTGAKNAPGTIRKIAKAAGIELPFTGPAQEKKLAEYIAEKAKTSEDHKRRVKLLLEDKYRLLTANLYDWDTFGMEFDE